MRRELDSQSSSTNASSALQGRVVDVDVHLVRELWLVCATSADADSPTALTRADGGSVGECDRRVSAVPSDDQRAGCASGGEAA